MLIGAEKICLVQYPVDQGGFAMIHMGNDRYISDVFHFHSFMSSAVQKKIPAKNDKPSMRDQDFGFMIWGCKGTNKNGMSDVGCWMLDVGCRMNKVMQRNSQIVRINLVFNLRVHDCFASNHLTNFNTFVNG